MARNAGTPYGDRRWKKIRLYVLARDGYKCQVMLPGCLSTATDADHIVPWSDGGSWLNPDNLQAACRPCNSRRANNNRGRRKSLPPSRKWL